jgi:hypothetical protein
MRGIRKFKQVGGGRRVTGKQGFTITRTDSGFRKESMTLRIERSAPGKRPFFIAGRKCFALKAAVMMVGGLGFLVMLLLGRAPVMAQEYIRQQEPVPESVDQVTSPIELSFKERPKIPRFLPWLKEQLKDTPAYFRDTKLGLNVRTYFFYRDNYPGSSPQINEAWALGGSLSYQSGWFLDHFSVGTVLYTSQPLYAPGDKDRTLLLKPGQEGYTVVGQIYGRVKLIEDNFVNIYRYEYNTPYINKNETTA